MADKYITETTIIPWTIHALVSEYHRHHGDDDARAVRIYRTYSDPKDCICSEWVLTRFQTAAGTAASAIHMVNHGNGEEYLSEYFSCERKGEKAMIANWEAFVKEESDECG